jgi:hypothetical protein
MATSPETTPAGDSNPYQSPRPPGAEPLAESVNKNQRYKSVATRYEAAPRHLITIIVAGLICWGLVHSIGSWLGGEGNVGLKKNMVRGGIVLGCVGFFLMIWWLLISSQKERKAKYRIPLEEPDETEK